MSRIDEIHDAMVQSDALYQRGFAAGEASRDAEIAELVASLSSLLRVIPAEVECNNLHHVPKHRHSHDETCPVVVAYGEAILQASKALAKVRKP